jgi:hypothetical protein
MDGCLEHLAVLEAVLGEARALRGGVYLAFLDMAKAFDSVSHHSIRRAMVRKGVPGALIEVILSEYNGATTVLQRGPGKSALTPITRGVKQGDPLSPILFNLVLDEIIEGANGATEGVRMSGHKISILAFADDLVLVAQTSAGLQRLRSSLGLRSRM